MTRDEIEGREREVVNNNSQYCSIVRTGIGTTTLILGGEVDAVLAAKPDNADDPIPWIELKTSQRPMNEKDDIKFERKLLRFWAQSFLLGVPKIVVGFRSPSGHLLYMEEFETQKIPGMVNKQGKRTWDGNSCINFTAAFLEMLKKTVVGEGVWRIRRRQRDSVIEVFKVEEHGTGAILRPTFKEHRDRMLAKEVAEMLGRPAASARVHSDGNSEEAGPQT